VVETSRPGDRALIQTPPVQMNTRRIVVVGTAIWFVAFVVLLICWHWTSDHHHRDWLWTCLAGWALGIVGYALMLKHRREGRTI